MAEKDVMTESDEKDEVIPVEVESLEKAQQAEAEATESKHVEEDDEDDEDDRLAESDEDKDEDAVNPNRIKRAKRRDARKAARERAERELQQLRQQNEILMRRVAAVEGNAVNHNQILVEQRLTEVQKEAQQAEAIIAKAVEAGNGEDVAIAMRLRDEAKAKLAKLQNLKSQIAANRQAQKSAPDPRVTNYAKEWLSANPWYNPKGSDEDSVITNAIDNRLTAEGYDPSTIEYWEELTSRVSSRINKNTASEESAQPAKRKGPPIASSREHAPSTTKKEVYVTPERKQAMMDAGVWEDPALRNKYLKAYRDYDKNSAR